MPRGRQVDGTGRALVIEGIDHAVAGGVSSTGSTIVGRRQAADRGTARRRRRPWPTSRDTMSASLPERADGRDGLGWDVWPQLMS